MIPSNAQDANGLLRTAIRCDDPVLFLEHKHLYRQTHNKGRYPGPDYTIPFGKAARVRDGPRRDGRHLRRARAALAGRRPARWRATGSRPRSSTCARLSPYDWDAIAASVRKTGRVVVAHEDSPSWGYGAEIAARIGGGAVRAPRRAGAPGGRARHLRRLQPEPGGRDPAPGLDARRGDARDRALLSRRPQSSRGCRVRPGPPSIAAASSGSSRSTSCMTSSPVGSSRQRAASDWAARPRTARSAAFTRGIARGRHRQRAEAESDEQHAPAAGGRPSPRTPRAVARCARAAARDPGARVRSTAGCSGS